MYLDIRIRKDERCGVLDPKLKLKRYQTESVEIIIIKKYVERCAVGEQKRKCKEGRK